MDDYTQYLAELKDTIEFFEWVFSCVDSKAREESAIIAKITALQGLTLDYCCFFDEGQQEIEKEIGRLKALRVEV